MTEEFAVVVPWFDPEQIQKFLDAWGVKAELDWLILQQDTDREGCGATKNRGVDRALLEGGADVVVVLDDDCYPDMTSSLERLARLHIWELSQTHEIGMFQAVTDPPSRGTPYGDLTIEMPVAASMGFWTGVGDYDAARQLVYRKQMMTFSRSPVHGQYFPLSGMNLAFRPDDWLPWCRFIDVPRFDDIWMGWLWQHEAYARGYCFSLNGPTVHHARQSNTWNNLRVEAEYVEQSEELWKKIARSQARSYEGLRTLLPPHRKGPDR